MRKIKFMFGSMILVAFVLAACGSPQTADDVMSGNNSDVAESANAMDTMDDEDGMADGSADEMSEDSMADEEMSGDSHDDMSSSNEGDMGNDSDQMMDESSETEMIEDSVATPPWFDHQFTDAATGQTFTINDFRGKVVLIETMAMWCSNCMRQQNEVKGLHSLLGDRDDFVGIGIDVDLNEDIVRLADYTQNNGFDWYYSVANQDVLSGISETLGGQFLNPPSTPIVIVDKDGNMHPLPFGIKSADDLLTAVEMYLN